MRRERRVGCPKVALVAALTAVLAASLGAAGALGSARGSVHTFSLSVVHLVSPPKPRWSPGHVDTPATRRRATSSGATPAH